MEDTTANRTPVLTALVTGAARRVGRAIARELHARGCNVAVHHRHSGDDAEALVTEFERHRPGSALAVSADLRHPDDCNRLTQTVAEAFGRIDILVNNASTFYPTPVGEIGEADWDDLMGTNLKAPLFLSQAAAPLLETSRGCIVNLIDIHGERPMKGHVVYSTAKAGLGMLTKSLARELAPAVRVNGVAPGAILWPEAGLESADRREIIERTALKRPGEPADIARAVAFLAFDAPYVTGHVLPVDGGRSLNQ